MDSWYDEKEGITFWEGSTIELLQTLNKIAQAYKVDTDSKLWPKAANSLTRRLKHILSNLREGLGIHVIISRNTGSADKGKKNTSTVKIEKISPLPPLSPPGQNHDQNQGKSGGDNLDGGDNTSTQQQISPLENSQNRAQKTESGDSDDLKPDFADAWNSKGYALDSLEKHREAIKCFDKAISIQVTPSVFYAYNYKGYALGNLKEYEEAIKCFDKATNLKRKANQETYYSAKTNSTYKWHNAIVDHFSYVLIVLATATLSIFLLLPRYLSIALLMNHF